MKNYFILLLAIVLFSCGTDDDMDNCNCKRAETYSGLVYNSVTPETEAIMSYEQRILMNDQCKETCD